jgi:hypothetical protein
MMYPYGVVGPRPRLGEAETSPKAEAEVGEVVTPPEAKAEAQGRARRRPSPEAKAEA